MGNVFNQMANSGLSQQTYRSNPSVKPKGNIGGLRAPGDKSWKETFGLGNTYDPAMMGSQGITAEQFASFTPEAQNAVMQGQINLTGKYDNGSQIMSGLGTTANGLGAAAAVGQAILGFKNYALQKDMFNAEKATTNANYINNAMAYNTGLANSHEVGLALGGGAMSADQMAASTAAMNNRKFSENAIV